MLDVHVPNKSEHTWTDFFIHIGTIVLGLFIALCLEQTVVYFDHNHQRHELIEDVQAEALHNLPILEADVKSGLIVERWNRAVLGALRKAKAQAGTLTVVVPPRPDYSVRRSESRAAWTVAHTNGQAALIPQDIAEVFDRSDFTAANTYRALEDIYAADSESIVVEARIGLKVEPGAILHLSPAERDDLAKSVAHSMAAKRKLSLQRSYLGGRRRCCSKSRSKQGSDERLHHPVQSGAGQSKIPIGKAVLVSGSQVPVRQIANPRTLLVPTSYRQYGSTR